MPVNDFEIKNIGPLKYVKCSDVPKLVLIAGPNGVGKSTLLEEIARFLRGERRGEVNIRVSNSPKPVYLPPHRAPSVVNLHRSLPIIGPRRKFRETLGLSSFSFSAPGISLPYFITSGSARSRLDPDFSPYFGFKYRLGQLDQEFKDTLAEVYRKYEKKEGSMPHISMPRMPDIYAPLREIIKQMLPGAEFDQINIEGDVSKIYFKNRLGAKVEFDHLSSGEKDILATIFPFVEREVERALNKVKGESTPYEDLVFLIDTPEAYLHPELQRRFLRYMRGLTEKEKGVQFLVATHSTSIINEAKPEELYILLFPDQVKDNQLVKVSAEEEKLYVIQDVLGDLGLLAAGKPILMVEGKTDAEILELLIPEIKETFALRYFKDGGKGKILNFLKAFKETIPELLLKGFRISAILDKDWGELIKDKEMHIFTWPVACIENFLILDCEATYEILKVLLGGEKLRELSIASAGDVQRLIAEIINDPKVQEKFIAEEEFIIKTDIKEIEQLINQEMKEKLFEIYKSRKERLERRKKDLGEIIKDKERALKELDGKVILKEISTKVNIETERLARLVADKIRELNKVPVSIIDLLKDINR